MGGWGGLVGVALLVVLVGCRGGPASTPAREAAAPASAAASQPGSRPAGPAPAGTLEPITLALPAVSGVFIPHILARDAGFFAEEGFAVELPVMRSNLLASGMASGEVDYAGSFSPSIRNALAGQPIRVIAATVNRSTRQFVVAPSITSIEQLRGKTVAITTIGDGPHNSGILAFEAFGIDPQTEVTWIAAGQGIERLAAVQQGFAQATILTGAEVGRAETLGLVPLLRLDEVAPLPESGVATSVERLTGNREQVQRVLRAMVRSLRYLKSDRAASLPSFISFLDLTPEEAGQAYDAVHYAYSDDGTLSERAMQFTLDSERKQLGLGAVPTSAVADFGPLYAALTDLSITPAADAAR